MREKEISCVFPMYNEESNIAQVVSTANSVLSMITPKYEIVIVDDGSKDQTSKIAEKLAQKDPKVKVISHSSNRGYGAALRTGFAACQYEIIFQSDGDNQFYLEEINKLLPYVDKYDFVVGYRFKRQDPWYRKIIATFYRLTLLIIFGIKLKDVNCAFKIFKKNIMSQINLQTSGAIINSEVFVRARRKGYNKIKEVGVNHRPREKGRQTGASFKVLMEALISFIRLRFGMY